MLLTRPGVLLGSRYLLHQRIGSGGMGEVWRAEDTMLRRPVALKVLHPSLSDDEGFRRRFVEEARTVAALRARGVVEIYDIRAERDESGEVMTYLVMQFLEGRSLHEVVDRQAPLPAQRVLPLLAQIADALEAAHSAGIVHRDIKPANIMVDAKGLPTILDFGIALRRDQTALTATGTVLGTVGYASPEQLRGEELTGASDLYSLGVIAYECLSGAIPFDRNSPAAVITGHLHETPPPLPPSVPQAAADLVDWAMAKDPADRPASAGMFARECRVAVAQARPVVREPNRTTVDLLVSSSPPPPSAAGAAGAMPPGAVHGAANAERPSRKRGRGVLLGLAAVVGAVGLTIGVMQFLDEDEPDGRSAGEDPSGGPTAADATAESADAATETASAEPPEDDAPPLPELSVLVNAETGECLIGEYDSTDEASTTWLDACHDGSAGDYEFGYESDAASDVRITHRSETGGGPTTRCMWWDGAELGFDEHCDVMAWQFTHLSTDEAEDADFWQIRAAGDGNYCLDVSDEANDDGFAFPVLNPCTSDDTGQQWRTAAL
ncbi:protein kinase [Glycomyces sp. NPDC049804]|uniref:serine/threonine-protein kinase n=1 Tax=Glycomyces sp. NPDC049804 TaxID=3154363 RepID=UPI003430CB8F